MRNLLNSRWRIAVLAAACLALVVTFTARPRAASPNVVISQVYGAGGNSNAVLRNDYVELFNRSLEPVSLNGWSIQYTSASGTGNFGANSSLLVALPNVTVAPGRYYLVQLASGGSAGVLLPAPDATGTINMAAGGGKVALVNGTTSLGCNGSSTPCTPDQLARIIDLVGWDGANFFETAAAPSTSTSLAVFRGNGGCTDTDNNAADFAASAAAPRNSSTAVHPCPDWPIRTDPTINALASPAVVFAGKATTLTGTVVKGTNPTSTGLEVYADLTAIGGDPHQVFYDDGVNGGDETAGDLRFTYRVVVAAATTVGPKTLPIAVNDGEGRSGSGSISLTVQPAPFPAAIHDIQGSGSLSPLAGRIVETTGIVTGVKYNGFFIQVPDNETDGDPSTSEGVYIYTNSAPPSAAVVGNLVDVIGTVQEYPAAAHSATEITSPMVTFINGGNALPEPIALGPGDVTTTGGFEQLERYEGMRVSVASMTAVGPSGTYTNSAKQVLSDGQFYAVITGTGRTFREPGLEPTAPTIPGMPAGVPHFDGNCERLLVDSDALGLPPLNVASDAVVTGITGPLDVNNGTYTIDPESTPTVTGGVVVTPLPEAGAGQFTVASWNMLSFTADPTRMTKASFVIRNVLRMPDIIGVEEMKDLTTLQALADRVNADAGPGSATYTAHLLATEVGQDVGFLVKSSVTDVSVVEMGRGLTFPHPVTGDPMTLNDRPPLVLRGTVADPARGQFRLTVIVNHLRSLIDVDADSDTGQFAREKRREQAEYLANLIAGYQANGEHVVSVGDYNAFQFNDGYVDVIGTILGTPTPGDRVLLASSDLVDPDFIDVMEMLPEGDRYSYVESGNAQVLDHIIVSHDMQARVAGVACARINADFPKIYGTDPGRPERVSDHDPVVGYFVVPDTTKPTLTLPSPITIEGNALGGALVSYAASALDAVDGAITPACSRVSGALFPLGKTTVTCTATDVAGNVASGSFDVTVVDTTAPAIQKVNANPATLWAPNHAMVPVTLQVSAGDLVDAAPACGITTVGGNDGATRDDWQLTGDLTLSLRAERLGKGDGRTYTIWVTCTDASGNVSSPASTAVFVPHDQRK